MCTYTHTCRDVDRQIHTEKRQCERDWSQQKVKNGQTEEYWRGKKNKKIEKGSIEGGRRERGK